MWTLILDLDGQKEEAQYESREEALEAAKHLWMDYDVRISTLSVLDPCGHTEFILGFPQDHRIRHAGLQ
jgi:hypothetical protein